MSSSESLHTDFNGAIRQWPTLADLLYRHGSLPVFFCHRNYGDITVPKTMTVNANTVAFTGHGQTYAYLPVAFLED